MRDRFKALKVIQDENNLIDEEDEVLQHSLDKKFEESYAPLYELRSKILKGEIDIPEDLIAEFDKRAEEMNDEEFKNLEVELCDVKAI